MEDFFNVGVKAIIRNKLGQVLVLKLNTEEMKNRVGWNGQEMWDIPGGRIKKGSDALKTLDAEIIEEIALNIKQVKLLSSVFASTRLKNEFYGDIGLVLFVYEVEIEDGQIVLNPENEMYEWVNPTVTSERLLTKYPSDFCETIKKLHQK